MPNAIENAKNGIEELLQRAFAKAAEKGELPASGQLSGAVEIPKDLSNGDYAANHALVSARSFAMPPRKVAEALLSNMEFEGTLFASAEAAGPGFMNFRLGPRWYADVLEAAETEGEAYCRGSDLKGKKYMVEFVSANPTGPMHMGNARGGVLGDTLASVLAAEGAEVSREFYVNDAGNQIEKFAESIEARYLQIIKGEDAVPFPEDGYHGDDIREIASKFYGAQGAELLDEPEGVRRETLARFGLDCNIPKMREDLRRYGIEYDRWFFESELHASGYVQETLDVLTKRGFTYESEGALWLKTAEILADSCRAAGKSEAEIEKLDLKDDVLRRSNGFFTYFAVDIAYHRDKFEKRGFDKVINIWGADHHGHVARLKAALDALGLDGTNRLDIVLMQLVKLVRDGETVRMSKRTGKAISLSDLLDEIPVDAARYFFNTTKAESQMEFDLGLALRQDSDNPVYYVQYAHARICTMLEALKEEGFPVPPPHAADASLLTDEREIELIKQLALLPEEVRMAARDYDPGRVNRFVTELAARFHRFYTACRIKGAEPELMKARLLLADASRRVIALSLKLLGVSAPEKM